MSEEVLMPKVGMSTSEIVLNEWLVSSGDEVVEDQVIATVESEKTVVEVEAVCDGFIDIRLDEGEEARPGELIAVIGESAEAARDARGPAPARAPATVSTVVAAEPVVVSDDRVVMLDGAPRVVATPAAQRLAEQHGLDLSTVDATGPRGRVTKADVERAVAGAAADPAPVPDSLPTADEAPEPVSRPESRPRRERLPAGNDPDLQRALHREMLRARALDEGHMRFIRRGRCESMSHPATGQEAISAGITAALEPDDILYPTFRGFGDYLGRGTDMNALVAELMGRQTGINRGVGGIHLGDREHNTHGVSGCLGANLTMAAGSAQAVKMRGEARVVMVHVGEGAFNTPDSHAMMNMAAIWGLPLVIIVANNQVVEFSYHDVHFPPEAEGVGSRAGYYGIPNKCLDGNDVELVHGETLEAVESARRGDGPVLLELITCRIAGHFDADPLTYIDDDLVEEWKGRDPISRYEAVLIQRGTMDTGAIEAAGAAAREEVDTAFKRALEAEPPSTRYLFENLADTGVL
ncbi:MAG: thiamine pyrophosphate-dependent enzyme [Acidimicrobiaceae bacterium]|nr:thiamine pyrophosphate-dependent enzyme [Acidimicrobiaceae bacterium]